MDNETERFTLWHGLFAVEAIALLIGLFMPITPSKTGSTRGLPHLLFDDPTYLEQVLVYFVATNLLFVILGAVFAIWVKFSKEP